MKPDNFERKSIVYPNAFEEVKTISRSVVEVAQSTDEVVWPRNICRRSSAAWQIQAQNRAVSSASEKCSNGTTTASTDTSKSSRNLCGRTDRSTPRPSRRELQARATTSMSKRFSTSRRRSAHRRPRGGDPDHLGRSEHPGGLDLRDVGTELNRLNGRLGAGPAVAAGPAVPAGCSVVLNRRGRVLDGPAVSPTHTSTQARPEHGREDQQDDTGGQKPQSQGVVEGRGQRPGRQRGRLRAARLLGGDRRRRVLDGTAGITRAARGGGVLLGGGLEPDRDGLQGFRILLREVPFEQIDGRLPGAVVDAEHRGHHALSVPLRHGHIRALRRAGVAVLQTETSVDLADDLRVVLDLVAGE